MLTLQFPDSSCCWPETIFIGEMSLITSPNGEPQDENTVVLINWFYSSDIDASERSYSEVHFF